MERVVCHIEKGTEYTFYEDRYYTDQVFYTTIVFKEKMTLWDIYHYAKKNLCKQIAASYNRLDEWKYVELYTTDIKMEFKK